MPIDRRIDAVEDDLRSLTTVVAQLAASTEQLAKGWGEMQTMIKQQASHATTIEHFRDEINRAFKQIADLRGEIQIAREVTSQLNTRLDVAQAVEQARFDVVEFLLRHWQFFAVIGVFGVVAAGYVKL